MTIYTSIVDPNGPGGEDYTTLVGWEAGEQTSYSSGDIAIADCQRDGSAKDTDELTIHGWTAGVIPKIIVNSSYRHEGKVADQQAGSNYIYVLNTTDVTAIDVYIADTVIDGLYIDQVHTSGATSLGIRDRSNTLIKECIIDVDYTAGGNATGLELHNGELRNTVIIGAGSRGVYRRESGSAGDINNCTISGFTNGIDGVVGITVTNTVSMDNSSVDFNGTFASGSDYTVTSDSTALGTNKATGKTSYTDYFEDYSAGDHHLKNTSNDLWSLAGVDLSGDFSDDIDGDTRSNWDIGCDEYVTADASMPPLKAYKNLIHLLMR